MKITEKNLFGTAKPHRKENQTIKTFKKYFSATLSIKDYQSFSYISRISSK